MSAVTSYCAIAIGSPVCLTTSLGGRRSTSESTASIGRTSPPSDRSGGYIAPMTSRPRRPMNVTTPETCSADSRWTSSARIMTLAITRAITIQVE